MAEVFEVDDSDFGGGSGHHGSVLPMRWVLQTPLILEQLTTQPKQPKQTKSSSGKRDSRRRS